MPRDKTGCFYYEWYPAIYRADTQHLSLAEDGAYRRLIDHYLETKSPLPADDRALARIVGVGLSEWESTKNPVLSFFKPSENPLGLLHHSFCDEIILKHTSRISKNKNNGKLGGRPSLKPPQLSPGKTKEITHPVSEEEPNGNPITEQNRKEIRKVTPNGVVGLATDPPPKTDFQNLILIWNEALGDVCPKIQRLTEQRKRLLANRLRDTFSADAEQWRAYCQAIRGSPFCVGGNDRGWRANIDWALKPGTVAKVLEGFYAPTDKPSQPTRNEEVIERVRLKYANAT